MKTNYNIKNNIKIKLISYDYLLLDKCIENLLNNILNTGVNIKGPIPLPTKKKKYIVLKSPHVHKKSKELFKINLHVRYLEILNKNKKTLNKIQIPSGIDLNIKV